MRVLVAVGRECCSSTAHYCGFDSRNAHQPKGRDVMDGLSTDELLAAKARIERALDVINAELRQRAVKRDAPVEVRTAEYCDQPRLRWMEGV